MRGNVRTGERQAYTSAVTDLWKRLGVALARLERIAQSPAEWSDDATLDELPGLQYVLHASAELALGITPPKGFEGAHAELVSALAEARDATAEVAQAAEIAGSGVRRAAASGVARGALPGPPRPAARASSGPRSRSPPTCPRGLRRSVRRSTAPGSQRSSRRGSSSAAGSCSRPAPSSPRGRSGPRASCSRPAASCSSVPDGAAASVRQAARRCASSRRASVSSRPSSSIDSKSPGETLEPVTATRIGWSPCRGLRPRSSQSARRSASIRAAANG